MGYPPNEVRVPDMTLRDWFAGQALGAMLTGDPQTSHVLSNPKGRKIEEWFAADAYAFADAMLAAREEGGE